MRLSKNQKQVQFGKNNLELAKSLFAELGLAYIDEVSKMSETYNSKIIELEERVSSLEEAIRIDFDDENELDEDMQVNISENIKCPYCGADFLVEYDETNHETLCPECNNLIELDWGEFEDDM